MKCAAACAALLNICAVVRGVLFVRSPSHPDERYRLAEASADEASDYIDAGYQQVMNPIVQMAPCVHLLSDGATWLHSEDGGFSEDANGTKWQDTESYMHVFSEDANGSNWPVTEGQGVPTGSGVDLEANGSMEHLVPVPAPATFEKELGVQDESLFEGADGTKWQVTEDRGMLTGMQDVKALYQGKFALHVDEEDESLSEGADGTKWQVTEDRGVLTGMQDLKAVYQGKFVLDVDEEEGESLFQDAGGPQFHVAEGCGWLTRLEDESLFEGADGTKWQATEDRGVLTGIQDMKAMYQGKFVVDVDEEEEGESLFQDAGGPQCHVAEGRGVLTGLQDRLEDGSFFEGADGIKWQVTEARGVLTRMQDLKAMYQGKFVVDVDEEDEGETLFQDAGGPQCHVAEGRGVLTGLQDALDAPMLTMLGQVNHARIGMQIFVTSHIAKTLTLDVKATFTVDAVKALIEVEVGIPTSMSLLTFGGKLLDDSRQLSHYSIHHEATLLLDLRLRGGMPGNLPPGSLSVPHYTELSKTFSSRAEANEELGMNTCCKGHAARVLKTVSKTAFLGCRLRDSQPPCLWHAMLQQEPGGGVSLHFNKELGREHNDGSAKKGKIGFDSLEERSKLVQNLLLSATSRPSAALSSARTEGPQATRVRATQLPQVQRLRKTLTNTRWGTKRLGDMAAFIDKHKNVPALDETGYFCFHFVGRDENRRPKITAVCSCKKLQYRFAQAHGNTVHIDGGFKFNVLGWPLSVLAVTNEAGKSSAIAWILTSTMQAVHVQQALEGFARATAAVTNVVVTKPFMMSDAEQAYRAALRGAFGNADSKTLMCYFHVVQSAKKYINAHAAGSQASKDELFGRVREGIRLIRGSLSVADFAARWGAIRSKWESDKVHEVTAWVDKKGTERHFISYFQAQWVDKNSEWHLGHTFLSTVPSTNNAAESVVKYTRLLAGGVVGQVAETMSFILKQAENVACETYDPRAVRAFKTATWRKAAIFRGLLETPRVYRGSLENEPVYVAHAKTDDNDVSVRPTVARRAGAAAVRAFHARRDGQAVTAEQLEQFADLRVFGYIGSKPFCTCPQFVFPRGCYHTLAVGLLTERVTQPAHADGADMSVCKKGNRRKAPPYTSAAPPPDERDARIRQLEEEVGQLRGGGAAKRRPAASNSSVGAGPALKRPAAAIFPAHGACPAGKRRRCTGKTSSSAAPAGIGEVAHVYVYQLAASAQEATLVIHLAVPVGTTVSSCVHDISRACGAPLAEIQVLDLDCALAPWLGDDHATTVGGKRRVLLRPKPRGG